jgi:hypothetical protein
MKYTQTTLDKLEAVVEESGYVLRYERGNFQSGYCILEAKKVVVLNKFLQTEGRINTTESFQKWKRKITAPDPLFILHSSFCILHLPGDLSPN